jgi:putative hydrolase of the HAD superfamily
VRTEVEVAYARMLRADAVGTLGRLRARGLGVGVVSDCTHELPACWPTLPVAPLVDATVFSVEVGERKPHPELYLSACRRLGVAPADVLYVGDGGSNELTGARAVGMTAVRLVAADAATALVYDPEEGWNGPVVDGLAAVLAFVAEGRGGPGAEVT